MTKQFDLLVFDWDGTLYDSTEHVVNCVHAAAADCGLEPRESEAIKQLIGVEMRGLLKILYPDANEGLRAKANNRYHFHFFNDKGRPCLFEGAMEILKELKETGYLMAIATSKSTEGLKIALDDTQLKGIFDATRTSEQTFSKPNPQMMIELMSELDVTPQRTLLIGDTQYDMQLAKNANVPALAVSYGVGRSEELLAYEPLSCIGSIQELPAALKR